MRVFVTGVAGQLGHDCVNELVKRGHEAVGSDVVHIAASYSGANEPAPIARMDYVQLDITDHASVAATIEVKPDAIIHCAAWTAVDAAEDERNKAKVHAINVDGTRYIAKRQKIGAKMLYLSTDYVFDGKGESPWQPDDKNYAPLNYYGQTKLEGELA